MLNTRTWNKSSNRLKHMNDLTNILRMIILKYPDSYVNKLSKSTPAWKSKMISTNKNTGSESFVYVIRFIDNKRTVVMKLLPKESYDLMMNEYQMYSVFNGFIKHKVSPYVLTKVPIVTKTPVNDKYPLFTTTYENLQTLDEYLTNKKVNETFFKNIQSILIQLLYTLHCMNKVGLRHNDLHTNNIFVVQNVGNKLENTYNALNCNGNTYYVPVNGPQIRIFDLDRSVKRSPKELKPDFMFRSNQKHLLALYNAFGKQFANNSLSEPFDTFKVLYTIYDTLPTTLQKILIDEGVFGYFPSNNKKFEKTYDLNKRLYREYRFLFKKSNSRNKMVVTPIGMKKPDELLALPYFQSFTSKPKKCKINERFSDKNVFA